MFSLFSKRRAFTLIELLIVVAIIAILAAIAVPNFLEAQTRAKISRIKADMRSLTTALEAYSLDHNSYVPPASDLTGHNSQGHGGFFEMLSTPIAYITDAFVEDPFVLDEKVGNWSGSERYLRYRGYNQYGSVNFWHKHPYQDLVKGTPTSPLDGNGNLLSGKVTFWALYSMGPDRERTRITMPDGKTTSNHLFGYWPQNNFPETVVQFAYDPTNGTKSQGEIWKAGGSPGTDKNKMMEFQSELLKYQF
ncbi:MAG: prepilin-type N-terminal cleavage/methylation domain-containing protein [Candidatus Sumerlaeia bacterium]